MQEFRDFLEVTDEVPVEEFQKSAGNKNINSMSQNLYEVYNNTFNEIQKDYLYIFSNGSRLENYLIQNIKNNSNKFWT